MSRFYIKEQVSRALRTKSGILIPWNDAGADVGWLETNDPGLITELDAAARRGIGGVRSSSKEEVEEQKKRAFVRQQFLTSSAPPWSGVRLSVQEGPFRAAAATVTPVDNGLGPAPVPPPPAKEIGQALEVPKEIPAPKKSRRPKAVAADQPAETT